VLLADDHQILLEGLRELLDNTFKVVGCASSGRELVALALSLKPDVVVTDINMPDLNGVEAVQKIRNAGLTSKAVFLTMLDDAKIAMKAFQAGGIVAGYVLKNSAGTELVTAIQEVLSGRSYITPRISRDLLREWCDKMEPLPEGITARQTEVLRLIAQGKTMKEVASLLDISTRTAEAHKYHDGTPGVQNHRPADSFCDPTRSRHHACSILPAWKFDGTGKNNLTRISNRRCSGRALASEIRLRML